MNIDIPMNTNYFMSFLYITSETTWRCSGGLVIRCPKSRTPPVSNSDKCSIVLSANGRSHPQQSPIQGQWAYWLAAAATTRHPYNRSGPLHLLMLPAAGKIVAESPKSAPLKDAVQAHSHFTYNVLL